MSVMIDGNEVILTGFVGGDPADDGWFSIDGFSASHVIEALAGIGRDEDVTLRVNSPGGVATEGAAIYAALAQHRGDVTVIIEGIAASAASLLAMAADHLVASPGAVLMIHDPAGLTMGDAAAHEKTIEGLNALGDSYAAIYADRTGKTVKEMRAVMRRETWYTAQQAVDAGFADRVGLANDNEPEPAAFAYMLYANAPRQLVALAKARGWKPRASLFPAAPAAPRLKENTMSDDPKAAAVAEPETSAAEVAARAAEIATLCASAGFPVLTAGLIKTGASIEQANARIEAATDIKALCARAKKPDRAEKFIAENHNPDQVARTLLDEIYAGQSPEVAPHVAADTRTPSRQWDRFVDRQNAKHAANSA